MSSSEIPAIALPIIEAYAKAIRPAVAFVMIGTVFTSMLVPLLVALFFFSTPDSRRRAVFILNVAAILLALVVGIVNAHIELTTILSPLTGASGIEDFIWNIFYDWLPWISEAVLVIRAVAIVRSVHPSSRRLALLLAFPILLKLLRGALFVVYLVQWRQHSQGLHVIPVKIARLSTSWIVKTSVFLEMVDNGYISGLFLWYLSKYGHPFDSAETSIRSGSGILAQRLRVIFMIAATNFVFPVLLNIAELIVLFVTNDYILAGYVLTTEIYISIISTVCATVWASSYSFREERSRVQPSGWSGLRFTPTRQGSHSSRRAAPTPTQVSITMEKTIASTGSVSDSRSMKSDLEGRWHEHPITPIPLIPLRREPSF